MDEVTLGDNLKQFGLNENVIKPLLIEQVKEVNDTLMELNTNSKNKDVKPYFIGTNKIAFTSDQHFKELHFEFEKESSYISKLIHDFGPKPSCSIKLNYFYMPDVNRIGVTVQFYSKDDPNRDISMFFSQDVQNNDIYTALSTLTKDVGLWAIWLIDPKSSTSYMLSLKTNVRSEVWQALNSYLNNRWVNNDHSDDSWVYEDFASFCAKNNNIDEAERFYKIAYKKSKAKSETLKKWADYYLTIGRSADAVRKINDGLDLKPKDEDLLYLKALAFFYNGNSDSSNLYCEKVLSIDSIHVPSILLKTTNIILGQGSLIELKHQIHNLPSHIQMTLFNNLCPPNKLYTPLHYLFDQTLLKQIDSLYIDEFLDTREVLANENALPVIFNIEDFLFYYPNCSVSKFTYLEDCLINDSNASNTTRIKFKDSIFNNSLAAQWERICFESGNKSLINDSRRFCLYNQYDYGYYLLAISFLRNDVIDSAKFYFNKASSLSDNKELLAISWATQLSIAHRYFEAVSIYSVVKLNNKLPISIDKPYSACLEQWGDFQSLPNKSYDLDSIYSVYITAYSYDHRRVSALAKASSIRERQQRYNDCVDLFEYALSLDSTNAYMHYNYGCLLINKKINYSSGRDHLYKALKYDATISLPWTLIVQSYLKENKIEQAWLNIENARVQFPKDIDICKEWNRLHSLIYRNQ